MNVLRSETEYEELLSLWADLEDGLAVLLGSPHSIREFELHVCQYERWLRELLAQDTDLGLYLLFQLAVNSSVGYSASHALTCAVLCQLMSAELRLAPAERDSLVRAALTMNIGMTTLQDQLARQTARLTSEQQALVRAHPQQGRVLLQGLGVSDALWLEVVARHHDSFDAVDEPTRLAPAARLARTLQVVDRYAALISPRKSREGRSAAESVRTISQAAVARDEVGEALVRVIGPCPPGTLVRLDDGQIAVVMRRGGQPQLPDVAIVADARGETLVWPRLHRTAQQRPRILTALAGSALRLRLNHFRVLQLGAAS